MAAVRAGHHQIRRYDTALPCIAHGLGELVPMLALGRRIGAGFLGMHRAHLHPLVADDARKARLGAFGRIEVDEPQVHTRRRLAGQNVVLRRALQRCKGHCGAHHRVQLAAQLCGKRLQQRPEQPQICKHHAQGKRRIRAHIAQQQAHRFGEGGGELVLFTVCYGPAQHAHRRGDARRTGVAARGARGELYVHHALFADAHHGDGLRYAGEYAVHNGAALVHHHRGPNAAFLQIRHDRGRALAGNLFVAGKGEVDIVPRHKALADQPLGRLQHAQQRDLGIQCAAAPQLALKHLAAERRMLPLFRIHGHNVVMRHQHGRLLCAFALPAVENARMPNAHGRARLVHTRV